MTGSVGAPPSVLHLLAPAEFGGLESVVTTLARGQLAEGQQVTVASFVDMGRTAHPFGASLLASGIPECTIAVSSRGYLAERRAVRRLIEELDPDVVHTHGYRPDVVDSGVARRMGVPTVTTVHGFTRGHGRGRLYEWIQRRWFRRFDAVVAVSAPMTEELVESGVTAERVHLLRNAWQPSEPPMTRAEARSVLGLDSDSPVLGWMGRLSAEKGPDVLIESFAACRDEHLHLSVVGGGPMEASLRLMATERGVAERIQWHGLIPAAGRYLAAFDVLLMTSWTEGTPMVLLEAMAAGVPVVTTAVGGIPDVVSEEEAILVPAGDVSALGDAITQVLANPDEASSRSERARMRLRDEFAVEPWVRRYQEIYASCL